MQIRLSWIIALGRMSYSEYEVYVEPSRLVQRTPEESRCASHSLGCHWIIHRGPASGAAEAQDWQRPGG